MNHPSRLIPVGTLVAALLGLGHPAARAQHDPTAAPLEKVVPATEIHKLIATIRPIGDSNVKGTVVFERTADGVKITAKIGGLNPSSRHAIHIHEFGDLGSDDASSAGDHFNPDQHPHATPDEEMRHAGDLGNLLADAEGNAVLNLTVKNLTFDLGSHGILGRAVIVHARIDDGSQPSGNAGDRIGGGVIGISKDATKPAADPQPEKPMTPTEPDSGAEP